MGLLVKKEGLFTVFSSPLMGGADKGWKDNEWIVGELRHLADMIEEQNFKIHSISLETDVNYKTPNLIIKTLDSYKEK